MPWLFKLRMLSLSVGEREAQRPLLFLMNHRAAEKIQMLLPISEWHPGVFPEVLSTSGGA